MDARGLARKSASKEKMNKGFIAEDDIDNDMMEEEEEDFPSSEGFADDDKKKKMNVKKGSGGGGVVPPYCQVDGCRAILTDAKRYYRRHKVCEVHAKAPVVIVAGLRQRFCQQCSRFHELSEFDEAKRSCRRRLAGHNERRRKSSAESSAEGSSRQGMSAQIKGSQWTRQSDEKGKVPTATPGNSALKHSQLR
ncbi:hypothetical protein SLA2020_042930 [Shorea laevis]